MSANFAQLIEYFENLARKHKGIGHSDTDKHFFRMELDEVLAGINRTNVTTPSLILEGYSYDYTDNKSDNLIKNRHGAFLLLDKISDKSDYEGIQEIWNEMEMIGDDILAKIKADKKNHTAPVIRDFDFSQVEATLIASEMDNHYGIRYTYTISSAHPTESDDSVWIDTSVNGSI